MQQVTRFLSGAEVGGTRDEPTRRFLRWWRGLMTGAEARFRRDGQAGGGAGGAGGAGGGRMRYAREWLDGGWGSPYSASWPHSEAATPKRCPTEHVVAQAWLVPGEVLLEHHFARQDPSLTVLANESGNAKGLAVDGTHVYWAAQSANTLWRVPIGGGAAQVFAGGQPSVRHVALTDDDVYWTTNVDPGSIMHRSKTGGVATAVASGQDQPAAVAVDATHLYWTNGGTGEVMRCALSACIPEHCQI